MALEDNNLTLLQHGNWICVCLASVSPPDSSHGSIFRLVCTCYDGQSCLYIHVSCLASNLNYTLSPPFAGWFFQDGMWSSSSFQCFWWPTHISKRRAITIEAVFSSLGEQTCSSHLRPIADYLCIPATSYSLLASSLLRTRKLMWIKVGLQLIGRQPRCRHQCRFFNSSSSLSHRCGHVDINFTVMPSTFVIWESGLRSQSPASSFLRFLQSWYPRTHNTIFYCIHTCRICSSVQTLKSF